LTNDLALVIGETSMSTGVMMERITDASPRFLARMAGVFQVLEGMTAAFGQVVVVGRIVVFGSAAATAANVLGHERFLWLAFASSLIGVVCHIAWAFFLYELLKAVNRRLSLFAALVILVGCAIQALTILLYVAPLLVLRGGSSLSAFTAEQLQALALIFFRLNASAFDIYQVFFGLWCVLIGILIFRSTFMPRLLGVLLAISGLGWMISLSPPLAHHLFMPYIAGASALGEIPLMLWCLVMGVNVQRWKEQGAAGTPIRT
jgi:hypothetical protein